MKPINTSIFDFPTMIAKGCVYVDARRIVDIERLGSRSDPAFGVPVGRKRNSKERENDK